MLKQILKKVKIKALKMDILVESKFLHGVMERCLHAHPQTGHTSVYTIKG